MIFQCSSLFYSLLYFLCFFCTATRLRRCHTLHSPSTYHRKPQDLNSVCDVNCRENAALMFVDPLTGLIVIVDGNSTGKLKAAGNARVEEDNKQG